MTGSQLSVFRSLPSLLLIGAVATFSARVGFAADPAPEVVARLGATDVTIPMLRDFVRDLAPGVRQQALADPAVMTRLVRQELGRMAVLKEALSQKWDQRPEVAARIERARADAIVASYLASVGAPAPDFPSDAQVQSSYDLNRDSLMAPRQYRLEQIFIALPAGGDKKAEEAAQKRAEDLARKAKAKGANFEDLARANSEHKDSASRGGDIGWMAETQIVPEIRSQIVGMNAGEVSDVIRTSAGWHIVRMVETKPAAVRPLAEVKQSLAAALRQRAAQEGEQTYLNGLLQKTPVVVNEIGIRKLFETSP